MSDPNLRRAVWLTSGQRRDLLEAARRAQRNGGNAEVLEPLLYELDFIEDRQALLAHLVRSVINGLCLPGDALPVHLCDAEADEVILFGELGHSLTGVIRPEPGANDDSE